MPRQSRRPEWKIGRTLRLPELAMYGIDEERGLALTSSGKVALECVSMAPELHIVSLIKNDKAYFYNRYVPGANGYFLADGEANPHLVQVEELLCMADIDDVEEDFKADSGGELCAFDQSMFRFLRLLVANTQKLDALPPQSNGQMAEGASDDANEVTRVKSHYLKTQ